MNEIYLLTEEPMGLRAGDMEGLLTSALIALHTGPGGGLGLLPALLTQVANLTKEVKSQSIMYTVRRLNYCGRLVANSQHGVILSR